MSRVSDSGVRLPSTGKPEFVMTGIQKPDGSVRLYASRDLKALNWGQRELKDYTTAWHIDADMQHMLVIDKPTWGEAFARAFEIWGNEDAEKAIGQRQAKAANEVTAQRRALLRGGIEDLRDDRQPRAADPRGSQGPRGRRAVQGRRPHRHPPRGVR